MHYLSTLNTTLQPFSFTSHLTTNNTRYSLFLLSVFIPGVAVLRWCDIAWKISLLASFVLTMGAKYFIDFKKLQPLPPISKEQQPKVEKKQQLKPMPKPEYKTLKELLECNIESEKLLLEIKYKEEQLELRCKKEQPEVKKIKQNLLTIQFSKRSFCTIINDFVSQENFEILFKKHLIIKVSGYDKDITNLFSVTIYKLLTKESLTKLEATQEPTPNLSKLLDIKMYPDIESLSNELIGCLDQVLRAVDQSTFCFITDGINLLFAQYLALLTSLPREQRATLMEKRAQLMWKLVRFQLNHQNLNPNVILNKIVQLAALDNFSILKLENQHLFKDEYLFRGFLTEDKGEHVPLRTIVLRFIYLACKNSNVPKELEELFDSKLSDWFETRLKFIECFTTLKENKKKFLEEKEKNLPPNVFFYEREHYHGLIKEDNAYWKNFCTFSSEVDRWNYECERILYRLFFLQIELIQENYSALEESMKCAIYLYEQSEQQQT